jgi:dihydroorotate dehydrogenase
MGTTKPNQTEEEFVADFALCAKFAKETGAPILEVNLSCPNIGNDGLVCYNTTMTEKVLKAIRDTIGGIPLIVKIGYFENTEDLKKIAASVNKYANAVSAINTLQAEIRNEKGEQALPGSPARLRSGVCGHAIKWAGLEMVKRLKKIKEENGYQFSIEGVGGVITADDFKEYINAGADSVMSATGAMWNPYLARDIKNNL